MASESWKWQQPAAPKAGGKLMVSNSLVRGTNLVEFVPQTPGVITWYSCGPTVYDSSHMGHARTYLSIDILQRILEDYFGYSVFSVMNVTDIDDKIILKARKAHLANQYIKAAAQQSKEQTVKDLTEAWDLKIKKADKRTAEATEKEKSGEITVAEANGLRTLADKDRAESLKHKTELQNPAAADEQLKEHITFEALGELLDMRRGTADVAGIFDICKDHAARFEKEFFEDMASLNIRRPSVITRVTEYVDKIISFIARIIENGFAYASNGSVYFDTVAFAKHPDHAYGKLNPSAAGASAADSADAGEPTDEAAERKSKADFALWKKSKAGEPAWPSPWGPGRPGWHIECSSMASDVLGSEMDVHFGGCDLKFPHHENELAQSEAFHKCQLWVKYFLHSGHLDIDGLKMSKSLKNFITIRQAMQAGYTARQLRLMVLLAAWDRKMNFSDDTMANTRAVERALTEFFHAAKSLARTNPATVTGPTWTEKDAGIKEGLLRVQKIVHEALLDNFNTPVAMNAIMELVRRGNDYITSPPTSAKWNLSLQVARYVTKIMNVFGLCSSSGMDEIGFGEEPTATGGASAAVGREAALAPVLDVWCLFRTAVRGRARALKDTQLLQMCDIIRDGEMPKVGVRLEDDGACLWKLSTPEEAMRLVSERKANERAAVMRKLEAKERTLVEDIKKFEAAADEPEALLREFAPSPVPGELPTQDLEGKELGKGRRQKLGKAIEQQKKAHEKYLQDIAKNPNMLREMQDKLAAVRAEMAQKKAESN